MAQDARRFSSRAQLGCNFAQIDGDDLSGYNRFGYFAGIGVGAQLNRYSEIQFEFQYSLRGSRYGKYDNNLLGFKLGYIDIPIIYTIKDWIKEDKRGSYHKTYFQGGLYYGRLIKSSNTDGGNFHETFKKDDIGWLLGCTFFANRNYGISGRFTRSLTPLNTRIDATGTKVKMISYFISLGLTYRFN
ncbi:MAG: outer membrane beta-barrel protein [Saprospiraceae bacterium]|nr:outer membrane beta-barrel protein [Saprospiraceae bacterium]